MTIHSAKGLEFDHVFITGLEEGLFPHENSASDIDGLEEERRLMYVAITRARRRLYLSFSQTRLLHGQTRYNLKSRFFDELSPGTLAQRTTSRDVPGVELLPVTEGPLTPDADTGEIMSPLAAFLTHASLEAGDNQAQAGQDAI